MRKKINRENAVKVADFMQKLAKEKGLYSGKFIDLESGGEDPPDDPVEAYISSMAYPDEGIGWEYGGIEITGKEEFELFIWATEPDTRVVEVMEATAKYAREITGYPEIGYDVF